MKVLIWGEFSGIVWEAFDDMGHDSWSCDLLPSEKSKKHIQGDGFKILDDGWDMMIYFYPCTNLCVSGARWFHLKLDKQDRDIENFRRLSMCNIPKTAGENPIGVLSTRWRKPDQIIQPWQFGHGETKATCLWLKNLPVLQPTKVVEGRNPRVHREPPSINRWKNRSRTYAGIARAMAQQWGS